jgi:hypothetical protein
MKTHFPFSFLQYKFDEILLQGKFEDSKEV